MTLISISACGPHEQALPGEATKGDTGSGKVITGLSSTTGPVIVMVHGYRYHPGRSGHCPHMSILKSSATDADRESLSRMAEVPLSEDLSWPDQLGVGHGRAGIGFGWPARGTLRQAHARAGKAAVILADTVQLIKRLTPGRPVHAIGHSLGARVILQSLHHLPAGALSEIILLAAADYAGPTLAALATPAGRRARVLHVTSRENRAFELGLRALVPPSCPNDRVLGTETGDILPTLRLDQAEHLAGLGRLGFVIAPPERRTCHRSTYRRPGAFALYRSLTGPDGGHLHTEVICAIVTADRQQKEARRFPFFAPSLPRSANPS